MARKANGAVRGKYARLADMTPQTIRETVDAYFQSVADKPPIEIWIGKNPVMRKRPPTPAGLARALGISTPTLARYLRYEEEFTGVNEADADAIVRILTDARNRIEEEITERGAVGDLDNVTVRQILKMLGYEKCIDDKPEQADTRTLTVVVQGAGASEAAKWSR